MEVEDRPSSAKLIIPMALLPLCATERRSYVFFLFFFLTPLFKAAPKAYGRSQARGRIGAAAAGLCHSHRNSRI